MIKVDEKFKEIKEQNLGKYAADYLVDSLNHNISMDFGEDDDWKEQGKCGGGRS